MTTKTTPALKLRIGFVHAAIWERSTGSGRFFSVTFERRYRDSAGHWQTSHSYDAGDLLALAKLADQAHSEILALRQDSAG